MRPSSRGTAGATRGASRRELRARRVSVLAEKHSWSSSAACSESRVDRRPALLSLGEEEVMAARGAPPARAPSARSPDPACWTSKMKAPRPSRTSAGRRAIEGEARQAPPDEEALLLVGSPLVPPRTRGPGHLLPCIPAGSVPPPRAQGPASSCPRHTSLGSCPGREELARRPLAGQLSRRPRPARASEAKWASPTRTGAQLAAVVVKLREGGRSSSSHLPPPLVAHRTSTTAPGRSCAALFLSATSSSEIPAAARNTAGTTSLALSRPRSAVDDAVADLLSEKIVWPRPPPLHKAP